MNYLGDFNTSAIVRRIFNTRGTTGAPITFAGTPACSVYKDAGTTESTTGVTLTVDFDSRTGAHLVAVDTSADLTFYSAGSDFHIMITAGTADSISLVGVIVGSFSLLNRSPLRPTTAGRTLDVSAGGEAGLDWANVGSPTTTLALTGTTIATSQVVASVSGAVGSVTGAVGSVTGNVGGSVASVTAGVTVTTNNDKTGYALSASGLASISAWTVALTGNITGNLSGSVGSVTAGVTVTTNNDKTGYSLAAAGLASVTAWSVAITGNITGNLSGSVGSVTGNVGGTVASVIGAVGSVTGNIGGNVAGSVASVTGLNAALLDVAVSTRSTYAGADTAGTTTLLARLTALRAGFLDNLQFLDMSIIDARDAILGDIPSAGAVAAAVWAAGARTLTAFGFSVTVGTNGDKTGYSLATPPPTEADIWTYATRTLTSGGGSGGASVDDITAALLPLITAGSFTLADRETLGHALTLEQFTALQRP